MKHITSKDNPLFKRLKTLAQDGDKTGGTALLDGVHLIQTWQQQKGVPLLMVVSESGLNKPEIAQLLPEEGVVCFPDTLFRQLSPVDTPTGVLAEVAIPLVGPERLDVSCVVLDGVQDPGNVGSILRTAAAVGIPEVWLGKGCARVWSPRVLRAAMGGHCFLTLRENCALPALLARYPGQKLATRLDPQARSLYQTELRGPIAWLMGNEGAGLSPTVAAEASQSLYIPMPGGIESLNVAAAAAVCLFEELRQKQAL